MEVNFNMTKIETVTISLTRDMMDIIRKLSLDNYRSISKQIAYLLSQAIKAESEAITIKP
jgi:hypothetical protein